MCVCWEGDRTLRKDAPLLFIYFLRDFYSQGVTNVDLAGL